MSQDDERLPTPAANQAMTTIALDLESDLIALPPPALPEHTSLAQALRERVSTRLFAPQPLPPEIVSSLLWAAVGINRPYTGGRTAPSAHNWQEIEVCAVMAEGSYRYDARKNQLNLIKAEDLRGDTGLQDFVSAAPLNLVYVADLERIVDVRPQDRDFLIGADVGGIAQNVSLYCAAVGLGTVVRGLVDRRRLAQRLGLRPAQRITLAQSVGYPRTP